MLEGVMLLWFILVGFSVLFVLFDALTNTPVSWVQKLAWILVTFYCGPFGLFFYLLSCRNPGPGMHEPYTRAPWKQALNSEMHCLAGDASGIILAAVIVSYFGLANGVDLILEYLSAFIVGLFIFQALMMRSMYDNDYIQAVRKTFFAETVSMNMVMLGMIPVMVTLMHHWQYGDNPFQPLFWFIMGLATLAGGITAYPINAWLVRNNLKHGCMTLPETGTAAPSQHEHEHKNEDEHKHEHGHGPKQEHAQGGSEPSHEHHQMGTLSKIKTVWIMVASFAVMLLAALFTSLFLAPISF